MGRPAGLQPDQEPVFRVGQAGKSAEFQQFSASGTITPCHRESLGQLLILIDAMEQAEWLAGGDASLRLQRPLPNEMLQIRAEAKG